MHWFAIAANLLEHHKLTQNIVSHFWRLDSEVKELSRWALSEACERECVHASFLASDGLLAIYGVCWLLLHHTDLCLYVHVFSLCMYIFAHISPFYEGSSHIELEAHPTPVDFILTYYICKDHLSK